MAAPAPGPRARPGAEAYRADIDGLRAVAVVLVVLFHAGLPGLGGGFVGVDVFFVISGFLITGILFRELGETGRIGLTKFYARRFARILPSLLLVTLATLAAGAVLLSSHLFEVHALAKSAVAALLFVANLHFLVVSSDYFAPNAAELPLLHTWSLGVEEQYYLVWPLLLILAGASARGSGRQRIRCTIAVLAVTCGSLAWCAWRNPAAPGEAFYLPVTRFWELGAGSLLALAAPRWRSRAAGGVAAVLGFALIMAGAVLAREGAQFPFPLAALPVLGTAAVILGNGVAPRNPVARALAWRPMVSLGLVSYAWYLWHWPLLAFGHVLNVGEPPDGQRAVAVAASLAAAYLTVHWYENPLRARARRLPARKVVATGAAAIALAVVLATATWGAARLSLLPDDPQIATAFGDRSPLQQACLLREVAAGGFAPPACLARPGRPRVVLWGDSHADQWSPALAAWASERGWDVEQLTLATCPPLLGDRRPDRTRPVRDRDCARFDSQALARIEGRTEPTVVVLAANWAPRAGAVPAAERAGRAADLYAGARSPGAARATMRQGLRATLDRLTRAGTGVVVVLQTPQMPHMPASCVMRLGAARCGADAAAFRDLLGPLHADFRSIARLYPAVAVLDPAAFLCGQRTCGAVIAGRVAYYDREHVAASVAISPASRARWDALLESVVRTAGLEPARAQPKGF